MGGSKIRIGNAAVSMAQLFIPPQLRELTGGSDVIEVPGGTVRALIEAAGAEHPALAERLICDGRLLPGLTVSVDGVVSSRGLLARVEAESEVHFLPAVGGG